LIESRCFEIRRIRREMDKGNCQLCFGNEDVKTDLVLPRERSVEWNLYINIG